MALSATVLRRFNAVMTIVWVVSLVPSLLWWRDSVLWVIVLSVWANAASHLAAWMAARAETAAESSDDVN